MSRNWRSKTVTVELKTTTFLSGSIRKSWKVSPFFVAHSRWMVTYWLHASLMIFARKRARGTKEKARGAKKRREARKKGARRED